MATPKEDAVARSAIFISVKELSELLPQRSNVVLLDVRFRPDRPDGRPAFRTGHIENAVYVDLPTELAGEQTGFSGRRPLPSIHDLQRDARRWGLNEASDVVIYDDNKGLQSGRAWWVLRWAGVKRVRILDGGLDAWTQAAFPLTTAMSLPDSGDIILSEGHLPVLSVDDAYNLATNAILVDARGEPAYRGKDTKPGETPEGHIPGAINLPTSANLDESGRLIHADDLRKRFADRGIDGSTQVGVYCGGGVAAAHEIAVLASLGIESALFPGSWSAWSSDPSRPVAVGKDPA
ncbi:sulfurtransferase [Phyllobacterium sp. SB3]|uniref:sulfurtransferase n=1 Tax=Phyllobacterium sp. SB3 TaxID=3156073 RepID=UPI0032B01A0F